MFQRIRGTFLEVLDGCLVLAGENFAEARDAEHALFGVGGFGNAVTEQNQCVFRFEFHLGHGERRFGDQPHRKGTLVVKLGYISTANQQRREMTRVQKFEMPVRMKMPKNIVA